MQGGKRPGAGRKPKPEGTLKIPMAIRIDPELREYLKQRDDATATIEAAIRGSKAFKEWKRAKRLTEEVRSEIDARVRNLLADGLLDGDDDWESKLNA